MDKQKQAKKIVILVIVGVIVVLLAGGYVSGAVFYQSHFFPNTMINEVASENLEVYEVKQVLSSKEENRELELIGRNDKGEKESLGTILGKDINLEATDYVVELHKQIDQQNSWLWVSEYVQDFTGNSQPKEITISSKYTYDNQMLQDKLSQLLKTKETTNETPKDAYISQYQEETNSYEIVTEESGSMPDLEKAQAVVELALQDSTITSVDLEASECYVLPKVTVDDQELINTVETANLWLQAEITYDWNSNKVVVDKALLKDWVTIENNQVKLDEAAIEAFVAENAAAYDTYGKNRNFKTSLGVELNLPSGAFGWKTDREAEVKELTEAIKAGKKISKEPVYSSKAPWKGTNDIGNSYVEIDLTNQHLYLYKSGTLVLESEFVSGDMDGDNGCPTPAGVFGLTYKTTNAVLRGADYETPVVYWMPYHGNFGMHDATWRTEFGGDIYLTEGSHGCVNLPLESAAVIYSHISTGFPVICYYY